MTLRWDGTRRFMQKWVIWPAVGLGSFGIAASLCVVWMEPWPIGWRMGLFVYGVALLAFVGAAIRQLIRQTRKEGYGTEPPKEEK